MYSMIQYIKYSAEPSIFHTKIILQAHLNIWNILKCILKHIGLLNVYWLMETVYRAGLERIVILIIY